MFELVCLQANFDGCSQKQDLTLPPTPVTFHLLVCLLQKIERHVVSETMTSCSSQGYNIESASLMPHFQNSAYYYHAQTL